jgi:NIMA (never in mitosis gene a)-related kinase
MLRVFSLEGIPKDRVQSIIKTLNKLSSEKCEYMLKFYEASFD